MLLGESSTGQNEIGGQLTSLSVPSNFDIFISAATSDNIFLVEISRSLAYQGSSSNFPYAIGEVPIGGLLSSDEGISTNSLLRYGSKMFLTRQTDSIPHVEYFPKIITPFNYETSIPLPIESSGFGNLSFGVISIAHKGIDEEALLTSGITGWDIKVKLLGTMNPGKANEYELGFDESG